MANQHQYQIVGGPSREELFDALRLRHEGRTVTLTVDNSVEAVGGPRESLTTKHPLILRVTVESIGVEDGSGNSWLLTLVDSDRKLGSGYVWGYFNTTRREGWLNVVTA